MIDHIDELIFMQNIDRQLIRKHCKLKTVLHQTIPNNFDFYTEFYLEYNNTAYQKLADASPIKSSYKSSI